MNALPLIPQAELDAQYVALGERDFDIYDTAMALARFAEARMKLVAELTPPPSDAATRSAAALERIATLLENTTSKVGVHLDDAHMRALHILPFEGP